MDPDSQIRPLRVFLVENHLDTRLTLQHYLEAQGHKVVVAGSHAEAMRSVAAHDSDVLITDIGLPDGDGRDLLSRVPFEHSVFAIAVSGWGVKKEVDLSLLAGFRRHMVKPFDLRELDALLDTAAREIDKGQVNPELK